jgi:hypothetical protein
MTDKSPAKNTKISPDWFVRGALTKAGDAFDRLLGRNWKPSSSLATSEIIERIKRLLDSEARDIPGKGLVVPHEIRLKVEWDKFSTEAEDLKKSLENELLAATADHINDSLYYTFGPLSITVEPDYFIKGVQLAASFGEHSGEEFVPDLDVTIAGINLGQLRGQTESSQIRDETSEFIFRFDVKGSPKEKRIDIARGRSISVGRAASNDLVLDDSSVSKIHASLSAADEGDLLLADTGSTNGTFLNGERIAYGKAVRVGTGDKVSFGDVEVSFAVTENVSVDQGDGKTVAIDGFEFTSRAGEDPVEPKGNANGSSEADDK